MSKDANLTVAFEVEFPELYTVTSAEYEAIHSSWIKAIKVLPNYSQDNTLIIDLDETSRVLIDDDYIPVQKEVEDLLEKDFFSTSRI